MKRTLAAAAATAAILLPAASAQAGEAIATQVADPNPATLGDEIVVSNTAGADNTCEGVSVVNFQLYDPSMVLVDSGSLTPDATGNWAYAFIGDQVGTWTAVAECEGDNPTAFPYFPYIDLPIVVQAPPTTVTSTTAPSTTTTAAAPATVAPAFTG